MAERLKALVLKTSDVERHRGFESLSLRQMHMEKYPRGRRGSPAKGVGCVECRPGSNPGFSAMNTDISWYKKTHRTRWVFCYTCKYARNRRLFEFVLQEYTKRLVGGFFYGDSSHF